MGRRRRPGPRARALEGRWTSWVHRRPASAASARRCQSSPAFSSPGSPLRRGELRNWAKKADAVLAREKGAGPRRRCEGGTAEVVYAVGKRRPRARVAVTYPPQQVLSRLLPLRVLVQRKSMELPTQIVVGYYKKGGSSARISIRSILDEASNVATEFAGGRRSAEFAGGRRTALEPSNVTCVCYSRGP